MKKAKIAGICLIVLILAAFVSVPVYNNYCAYNVEKMLCETPLPEQTELIEAISQAGKLTGNGNGMQYFGAILIKSELSLEELDAYYLWKAKIRYLKQILNWTMTVEASPVVVGKLHGMRTM